MLPVDGKVQGAGWPPQLAVSALVWLPSVALPLGVSQLEPYVASTTVRVCGVAGTRPGVALTTGWNLSVRLASTANVTPWLLLEPAAPPANGARSLYAMP